MDAPTSLPPKETSSDEESIAATARRRKICIGCKVDLLLDDFYKDDRRKDGRFSRCKVCSKKCDKERRERHRVREHIPLPATKTCPACKTTKVCGEFYPCKVRADGLFGKCKDCCRKASAAHLSALAQRPVDSIPVPVFKMCNSCSFSKPADEFRASGSTLDGLRGSCTECLREDAAAHRERLVARVAGSYAVPDKKFCPSCELVLPSADFYETAAALCGLETYCKLCQKERQTKKKKRVEAYVKEQKRGRSCVSCGESHPLLLEFDHVKELGEKRAPVSTLQSISAVDRELPLTQLLCLWYAFWFFRAFRSSAARCHRRKSYTQAQERRNPARPHVAYDRGRQYVRTIKLQIGGCALCPRRLDPDDDSAFACFDFDHIDPATKSREISKMTQNLPEQIAAEIAKCRLLCCVCHWFITRLGEVDGRALIRSRTESAL